MNLIRTLKNINCDNLLFIQDRKIISQLSLYFFSAAKLGVKELNTGESS